MVPLCLPEKTSTPGLHLAPPLRFCIAGDSCFPANPIRFVLGSLYVLLPWGPQTIVLARVLLSMLCSQIILKLCTVQGSGEQGMQSWPRCFAVRQVAGGACPDPLPCTSADVDAIILLLALPLGLSLKSSWHVSPRTARHFKIQHLKCKNLYFCSLCKKV